MCYSLSRLTFAWLLAWSFVCRPQEAETRAGGIGASALGMFGMFGYSPCLGAWCGKIAQRFAMRTRQIARFLAEWGFSLPVRLNGIA